MNVTQYEIMRHMRKQGNKAQIKGTTMMTTNPETDPKEMEVYELSDKELNIKRCSANSTMQEQNESISKEIENIKNKPTRNFGKKEYIN